MSTTDVGCRDPAARGALIYRSCESGPLLTQSNIVVFWPSWYRPACRRHDSWTLPMGVLTLVVIIYRE
jgi:hypothetical protein